MSVGGWARHPAPLFLHWKTSYILKHFIGTFIFFLVIFVSAGKLYYWQHAILISGTV
jgi:hypothetical protein